jgi:aminopeptidase N
MEGNDYVYITGACLVRLMIELLGEDTFKIGINNYLTAL